MIAVKLNLSLVDETRIFKGKKGEYLDLVLIDKKSEFADGFVVQNQTKEERMKKVKMPIVGSFSYIHTPKKDSRPFNNTTRHESEAF